MDKVIDILAAADPFQHSWPIVLSIVVGIIVAIRSYMGGPPCVSNHRIPGRVVIVTGGSSGIGFAISRELAARGAIVIMACRNLNKGEAAKAKIRASDPAAKIQVRHLDLASFETVYLFAEMISNEYDKIDALVNNAGEIFHSPEKTVDGFEPHLQVNFLSSILLTDLLCKLLESEEGGRVVFTTSDSYAKAKVDKYNPLNLGSEANALRPQDAFALSKALLVMWTHFIGITKGPKCKMQVFAYSPGMVRDTKHMLKSLTLQLSANFAQLLISLMRLLLKSPEQGATTAVYLVTDPLVLGCSGEFFTNCTRCEIKKVATDLTVASKMHIELKRFIKLAYIEENKRKQTKQYLKTSQV